MTTSLPERLGTPCTWLFLSLAACASPAPGAPASQVPAAPSAAAAASEDAESNPDRGQAANDHQDAAHARAVALARDSLQQVAAARGLPPKGDVTVEIIDRIGVREFVKEALYKDTTPEELLLLGRIDSAFGVLPVGADPEQVLLDLYEDGVLGIYDPERKVLLIGDFVPRPMLAMVVGHEIAHGLQDMYYDLEGLQEPNKRHSELDAARTFLVEGDAQASYLAWRAGDAGPAGISDELLRTISDNNLEIDSSLTPYPILARALQMPYTDGTATVLRLAREQGWPAVDALYTDLPTTSEQMMHLDKLVARESAHEIVASPETLLEALPGYEMVWDDELGEAAILAMLAEVERPDDARRAAAGWGGDRFMALDRSGTTRNLAPLIVGLTSWDTKADAREFEPAMRRYLEAKKPGDFYLARRHHQVLFATHIERGALTKSIAKHGWGAFKR